MRALFVTTTERTGGWLAEALSADSASEVVLEESQGVTAGLGRLRDQVFDAVLVSHEPGELDALELIEGLRAGGSEEPLIVLGTAAEPELSALCYEVGADAYLCVNSTTTRSFLWTVARAIERHHLIREMRRLTQADRHRLQQEHHEAERLLAEQRGLIRTIDSAPSDQPATESKTAVAAEKVPAQGAPLPEPLKTHYRELLRAHVIMGSGNLAGEMSAVAELLAKAGISSQQTMQLHVDVVAELIRGLGNRSARHVMNRADLLMLELLMHLTEAYHERYNNQVHPPRQKQLPGFDPAA
jgi:DNA-binding NarL/FixJ family response regulator